MSKSESIEAAFRVLPLLPGTEVALQTILTFLVNGDFSGSGKIPAKFTLASEKKTQDELQKLEKLSLKLAEHIDNLHQPAIFEMWDRGMPINYPNQLLKIAEQAEQARLNIVKKLAAMNTAEEPSKGGRPGNAKAQLIVEMLAIFYYKLSGELPKISTDPHTDKNPACGPFFKLVKSVFAALNLSENAEHFARQAAEEFKKKTPQKY